MSDGVACAGDMVNLADLVGYRIPWLVSCLADDRAPAPAKRIHEAELSCSGV